MATKSENNNVAKPPSQLYSSLPHTHTRRPMKEYVVTDAELDQISMLNTFASALFSGASAAGLFALGLYTSATIQGNLSESATVFVKTGEIVGGILAGVFAGLGFWLLRKKRSKLSEIRAEAEEIDQVGTLIAPPPTLSQPTPDTEGSETE